MPYRGSDSDTESASRRRKKKRTHTRSSSSSSGDHSSDRHRRRKKNAYSSQDKSRRRRSSSNTPSRYSKKATSSKRHRSTSRHRRSRSRSPSSRRRSRSRSPKHWSRRSRSGSSSRRHSRSPSDSSRRSWKRSPSVSPRRSKKQADSNSNSRTGNDSDKMKHRIQQVMQAAAIASAELREKGLLSKGSPGGTNTPPTVQEQMERAKMIEDINAPSFSQQAFVSKRKDEKKDGSAASKEMDPHSAAIFGSLESLVAASKDVVPLCNWREKPELLVHENLMENAEAKLDRWKRKLAAERRKRINGVALGSLSRTDL